MKINLPICTIDAKRWQNNVRYQPQRTYRMLLCKTFNFGVFNIRVDLFLTIDNK